MIYIDRSTVPIPKKLKGATSSGGKERQKAIDYYGTGETKAYDFKVYRHEQVKGALIELFKGKCAYCESKFLHVYSGDVEHFRPKGEITEADDPKKPGYYWLAADWDNLLLSCRNCNQKLKHEVYGQSGKQALGKMNQFPLTDNTKYIRKHTQDYKAEEDFRLLLNPCIEDPEEHLEFDIKHAIIKPKKIGGKTSEMGKKSIEVYVLQRVPLVLARERYLIDILAQIQRIKEAVKNVSDHQGENSDIQFYYDKILERELSRLKVFIKPTEEFSAMAKQVVNDFFNANPDIEL